MDIKPISNNKEYQAAVDRLDALYNAKPGTPEAEEYKALAAVVVKYENKQFPNAPIPKR